MPLFVRLIGSGIAMFGLMVIALPEIMGMIAKSAKKDKSIYFLGILRIVVGFALMMAAIECRMMWTIFFLGILLIVNGMAFFILGLERMRNIINWMAAQPSAVRRGMALVAFLFGVLIVYGA